MPLAKACARRYCGRGAEYEDLLQEGCLALLQLIPRCPTRDSQYQSLPLFLKRRVPGRVRDAAASMRHPRQDSLEDCLELGIEPAVEDCRSFELLIGLNDSERALADGLAAGCTQKEMARRLGVTQQAVSRRIAKLRIRLAPLRAV